MKQEKEIMIPKTNNYFFEFKNVSFKYPNSESYVLKHINLKILPKEKIAIVGLNGSGKSTIIEKSSQEIYSFFSGNACVSIIYSREKNCAKYR